VERGGGGGKLCKKEHLTGVPNRRQSGKKRVRAKPGANYSESWNSVQKKKEEEEKKEGSG